MINQRWLNFKFITSFIILIMVTVYSFIYDNSDNSDLWLCVWCICIVRFVDAIDEMRGPVFTLYASFTTDGE